MINLAYPHFTFELPRGISEEDHVHVRFGCRWGFFGRLCRYRPGWTAAGQGVCHTQLRHEQVFADCEYILGLSQGTPAMVPENVDSIKALFVEMRNSPHPATYLTAELISKSADGKEITDEENSSTFAAMTPFCLDRLGEAGGIAADH